MKLKKSDKVKIIAGKDKGKEGTIEKVFSKTGKVLISGLNIYKKHLKKGIKGQAGGIIDVARPLPISNVALICPKCGKTTRVGFRIEKTGEKLRICRKCQEVV